MAIKVRANERLIKWDKDSAGEYRYCLAASIYSTLSSAKVINEACLRSGISKGVMSACWDAAGQVIKAWATEGHSVALPGLGYMRFGLRSDSVTDVNDVSTELITSRRVIFTPSTDIKEALAKTSVQITCYDRNGNEVKRVTSNDSGDVEDPEQEDNENTNGSSSSNENSGSNENNGSSGTSGNDSGTDTGDNGYANGGDGDQD